MKNLLLIAVFALFTIVAVAQEKPKPNTATEITEKGNHNTTRSNRTSGGIADLNTDADEDKAGIFEKRKCIKAGGTYYENPSGAKFCMPARANMDKTQAAIVLPTEEIEGGIFERRKCLKSGGVFITNSHGSKCLKKLSSSSQKL